MMSRTLNPTKSPQARRKLRRTLTPIAATAFGVAMLSAIALPASAATATSAAPVSPALAHRENVKPQVEYTQIRMTYNHNLGDFSGDWKDCLYVTKEKYTQHPACNNGVSVSVNISGNFGYSNDWLSSNVGFNVSYSATVGTSDSVTVKPGGSGWFQMGFRYDKHKIGVHQRQCDANTGICSAWSKVDNITVQKHLGTTYRYAGTGAESN